MTVSREQRHLVVVSHFLTTSRRYRSLYSFLERATVPVVQLLSSASYATVTGAPDGTLDGAVEALRRALARRGCRAVDLVLACHGQRGKVRFEGGSCDMATLARRLGALRGHERLRLAYDLCCYGDSHAPGFLDGGFSASVGSVGVNANSAFELPTVLGAWTQGHALSRAVEAGNDPDNRRLSDAFASLLFRGVDSRKELRGDGAVTIDAAP